MTDPWYFVEIPAPASEDEDEEEIYAYNELMVHLCALAASGAGTIPRSYKTHATSYLSRWHPHIEIPSLEDA